MKNLKKVFAVVIALSLVLTAMIPAFAETAITYTYEAEANVLHSVGLYAGVSPTEFNPDLGNNLTREQAVTLIAALFSLSDQAKALTDAEATTLLKDVKDVKKISSWAKKYVAYAIKTKISGGYPNGNWGPQDKIVGKQIAKMILNQLGYTDNDKYPYATAAEELAKLSGLAPTAAKEMNDKELLRDDAVGIFYGSLTAKPSGKTTTLADDLAVAKPDFVDSLAKAGLITPQEIKTVATLNPITLMVGDKAADKLPKTVKVTYKDDTTKELAVTWPAVDTTKAAAKQTIEGTFAGYKTPTAKIDVTVNPASGAITGAVSDNLKTVFLQSSKAIDDTTITADTLKVYKDGSTTALTRVTDYTTGVSDDKLTLGITFTSTLSQNATIKVTIDGVKDTDAAALAKYENTVTIKDVTDPVFSKLELQDWKTLLLTSSEPLSIDTNGVYVTCDNNAKLGVKVDGAYVVARVTAYPTKNQAKIELYNGLAKGDHTINLSVAKDFAQFVAAAKDFTVTRPDDTAAPVAQSITYLNKNQVKVTFDENVDVLGATFEVYQAGDATNLYVNSASNYSVDGKNVTLTLTTAFNASSVIGIDVKYKNVKDAIGNTKADFTTVSGKATDDSAKPTVASIVVEDANYLKVTFNKDVNASGQVGQFILLNSDGSTNATAASSVQDYSSPADNKVFKVRFAALDTVDATAYKVKVTATKDKTIRQNTIDDVTLDITTKDTKKPKVSAVVVSGSTTTYKWDIYFTEVMDSTSATTLSNYYLGTGNTNTNVSSVTGATATLSSDKKKVTLLLPNKDGSDRLACDLVKDVAGNTIDTANATIANPFVVAPVTPFNTTYVDKAELTAKNTIKLSLKTSGPANIRTFGAVDARGFKFEQGTGGVYHDPSTAVNVIYASISSDGTYVTLTTNVDISAYATLSNNTFGKEAAQLYYDSVTYTGTTDQFGNVLTIAGAGPVAIVDKVLATQSAPVATATIAPYSNTIDVAFDEDISAVSATGESTLAAAFTIKASDGTTLVPFTDYTTAYQTLGGFQGIRITIVKSSAGVAKTYNVQLTNPQIIKDVAGNAGVTVAAATDVANIVVP